MLKKVIFTAGYDEREDDLIKMKGHRSDVLVEDKEGLRYELNFIDIDRLKIELENNLDGDFFTDVGLIVLDEITIENILNSIEKLSSKKFFTTQKPVDVTQQKEWVMIDLKKK